MGKAWRLLVKYHRSYSTFRHIFNAMLISLLVSIILLGSILSGVFSSVLTRQTNEISTRMLVRLTYIINQIYTETHSVMISLGYGENIDLNAMMFGTTRDRLRDYSGFTRMNLLQTIYPSIAYIGTYSGVRDELQCTVGLMKESSDIIRNSILDNYNNKNARLIIPMNNRILVPIGYDSNVDTLTMVYYSPLSGPNRIGAVFIGIDCEYMSRYIETVNEDDSQMTFIVDAQGTVLSHPDSSQIFADYQAVPHVRTAILSQERSGFFFADIGNRKHLVTYMQDPSLGWTYMTVTPQYEVTQLIRGVHFVTILASLSILLVGIVLSLMTAKNTFNPIASLLTRAGYSPGEGKDRYGTDIGYLNDQFSAYILSTTTNETVLLNHALKSLLMDADELDNVNAAQLEKNKMTLNAPFYMICLLNMTRSQQYLDMARKEKQFQQYALAHIAIESLDRSTLGVVPVFMSSSSVALIVRLESHTAPKDLVFVLMEMRNRFMEQSNMSFSAAISGVCNDFYLLPDAYKDVQQLMTERYFSGEDDVFQTRERMVATASYNSRLEHEIWSAITAGEDERIKASVQLFVDELRSLTYEYARYYLSQLTLNIIAYSMAQTVESKTDPFSQYKRKIEASDSLEDAREALLQFCRQLAMLSQQIEDPGGCAQMILAQQAAKEHYMEPGFSSNVAALEVGLSITYFNRQFRQKTGQSYSNYLNSHRLNEARLLLCTTNFSMSRICQNVGLTNESYFYALFKREYGMTPHQYRHLHKDCADPAVLAKKSLLASRMNKI